MPGKLIVLTGPHKIISGILKADKPTFGAITYYPSILDDLKQRGTENHWEKCPFLADLLMYREAYRDSEILPLLRETPSVTFIEQWHIGNIAWIRARSSDVGQEYERKLSGFLGRFGEVDIEIWYVSTDLEKVVPAEFRSLHEKYCGELHALITRNELRMETVDGEAPLDSVSKRVMHLLASKINVQTESKNL